MIIIKRRLRLLLLAESIRRGPLCVTCSARRRWRIAVPLMALEDFHAGLIQDTEKMIVIRVRLNQLTRPCGTVINPQLAQLVPTKADQTKGKSHGGRWLVGFYRTDGKDAEGAGQHALQKAVPDGWPHSDGEGEHHEPAKDADVGPEAHLPAGLIEQLAFLEREPGLPMSTLRDPARE